MGKTPYVEFLELQLRRRSLTFDVEVQLVMTHHRAAASLEQNQISHLRQHARLSTAVLKETDFLKGNSTH